MSGPDLEILGTLGAGTLGDVLYGWNVTQESTPNAPGDFSGGTGSFGLSVEVGIDTDFQIGRTFPATIGGDVNLSVVGTIIGLTTSGSETTQSVAAIQANQPLYRLSNDFTAEPIGMGTRLSKTTHVATVSARSISGIAQASPGLVLYTSYSGDGVRGIDPRIMRNIGTGFPTTASGSGNGQFNGPSGISVEPISGDVYVADTNNNRVQRFTSGGTFISTWGVLGTADGQFNAPRGLIVTNGSVYVVDTNNNRVQYFTLAGVFIGKWSIRGTGTGTLSAPTSIAYAANRIYVTDDGHSTVSRYSLGGAFAGEYVMPAQATGITGDGNDGLLILLPSANVVLSYTSDMVATSFANIPESLQTYDPIFGLADGTILIGSTLASTRTPGTLDTALMSLFGPAPRLSAAFRYYALFISNLRDTNATQTAMSFSYESQTDPIIPGARAWVGNLWDYLKQLCSAYARELSLRGGSQLVVRDVGDRPLEIDNMISGSPNLNLDYSSAGRSINVPHYGTKFVAGVFYDAASDDRIFEIGVGQSITEFIQTTTYPISISQPNATSTLPLVGSSYSVLDSNNIVVDFSSWQNSGAGIFVSTIPDTPGMLRLDIKPPPATLPGTTQPYKIARMDGGSPSPSLQIGGSAIIELPEGLNLLTGANQTVVSNDIALDVRNIFINSLERAYDRGMWMSVDAGGALMTLSTAIPTAQMTAFGLLPGMIISLKESRFRIRTVSTGRTTTDITAVRHVTTGEFDALHSGETVGQFDTFWSGKICNDLKVKPLRKTA